MFLGLDVGGTHTDAVLLNGDGVVSSCKAVTNHRNLLQSMNEALETVTRDIDKKEIRRINLSTTLSTNAIVENRLEEVGLVVSSGPGIDPGNFVIGNNVYFIDGSIDHRGTVIKELNRNDIKTALDSCRKKGLRVYGVVTKFSTRNPDHENELAEMFGDMTDFVTLGHRISGQLNFPRRIGTAYYNSAVWRIYNSFSDAIEKSLKKLGLEAGINILKADGGTMPLELSRQMPVESILSGPAASILGIISLCNVTEDSIILDIGGTTSDIAIFASGAPLLEREGVSFNSSPTLVRSLRNRSIGIGGDSVIRLDQGEVRVGPLREGPSMAEGGPVPTLVDALNYIGTIEYGRVERSREGIQALSKKCGMTPEDLAEAAVRYSVQRIKEEVDRMVTEINEKPVYTIHEMLEGAKVAPVRIYAMGGPAMAMKGILERDFGMEVTVPENYQVANAIGAAVARTTFSIELFADTGRGTLLIPNLNVTKKVNSTYTLESAEQDAVKYLGDYLADLDVSISDKDIEILESSSFRMIQGVFSSGNDIRVKCQIKPGVTYKYNR